MQSNYRSETEGLQTQLQQQQERIAYEISQLRPLQALYHRRIARSTAGIVGVVCGVGVFLSALLVDLGVFGFYRSGCDMCGPGENHYIPQPIGVSTCFLLAAPVLSGLAYLLAWVLAPLLSRRWSKPASLSDDLQWDLAVLSTFSPMSMAKNEVLSVSLRSFAAPLVALSLLMPLSLHFLVSLLDGWSAVLEFDQWIKNSATFVSHCHLVLVVLSVLYVRQLHGLRKGSKQLTPGAIWLWTSFSAMLVVVPAFLGGFAIGGLMLGVILVFFVFVTGVFFIPPMFYWAKRQWEKEQTLLNLLGNRAS